MKHINKTANNHGFTIVELLIVIVAIGILAALAIVSYNGIQTRASNASKTAAMNSSVKMVELYKTLQADKLPWKPDNSIGEVCIGDEEDYPEEGVFQSGECLVFTEGAGRWSIRTNNSFNDEVNRILGKVAYPSGSYTPVKTVRGNVTEYSRGIIAADFGYGFSLYFSINGNPDNVNCPRGDIGNNRCTVWISGESNVIPVLPH